MTDINFKQRLNQAIIPVQDFPKPGVLFRDISPIFLDTALCREIVKELAEFSRGKVDVVCGIESRGFLFGISLAMELEVPFILIRKKGKLPPPVISEDYDLEYGSAALEMKGGQLESGTRVVIHDDLLATGGTTGAAADLVKKAGGLVTQFSFLIELKDLEGRKKLENTGASIHAILSY